MNKNVLSALGFYLALLSVGCSKDSIKSPETAQKNQEQTLSTSNDLSLMTANGATQVSGVGFYATTDECNAVQDFSYAVTLTGDMEGCLYAFIDDYECSPSGTYREEGREYFVGMYKGKSGTFWTTYKFEAKYEGCAAGGAPLGAEIFGRCQHPIVKGSGTGGFEGATGQLNFKDDVEVGNFPYTGHVRF